MAAIVVSFSQTWESGFGRSSKIEAGKRGMVVWEFCGEGKEVVSCQLSVFSFQNLGSVSAPIRVSRGPRAVDRDCRVNWLPCALAAVCIDGGADRTA